MAKTRFLGTVEVPKAQSVNEAVNYGQVKEMIDRHMKEPVKVATTGELTGTYADGVLTLDAAVTEIDGVTLTENDAILVKDQLDKTQNGIYTIDATGAILTRREDFAVDKIILNNTFVNVMEGDSNGDTRWTIVSDGVLTVGTSNILFIKDIDTVQGGVNVTKATITGDDTTTEFNVAHNLNLTDAQAYMLVIKDAQGNDVVVNNAPTLGNEANAITLEFAVAPEVAEGDFKVFIIGLE